MPSQTANCVKETSVIQQLMGMQIKISRIILNKLDELRLMRDTRLLIDRYVSGHVTNNSRYGELIFQIGFSDC